jgi:hypothetical protein
LYSTSTAHALIAVRGPTVTYGLLKFTPQVSTRAYSIDVDGFTIRRGNDRFSLQDLPVSRVITAAAREDIIVNTFEMEEGDRSSYLEIDFEIPEYDELVRVHFRAVENDAMPDMLFFEVEDEVGNWMPVDDVLFVDLLPESFIRTMETSVMSTLSSHNLDLLPIAAE